MNNKQNYKNILQGKRNRAAGQHFEELIEAACRHYRVKEIAEIDKTPEPFKVERHIGQGKFIGHYEKQAQPDFKGSICGGGSIVFEAKHTDTDRLAQSVVSDEQVRALNRHSKMGAHCFVIISFGFRLFYKIPWEQFQNMKELYGRKYIMPEDIKECRIKYAGGVLEFLEQGGEK